MPADEWETLVEERRLVELLNGKEGQPIVYDGFHDFIEFRVRGTLPKDKEKMLAKLDKVIEEYKDKPPIYTFVRGECPNLEKCDGNQKVWTI